MHRLHRSLIAVIGWFCLVSIIVPHQVLGQKNTEVPESFAVLQATVFG